MHLPRNVLYHTFWLPLQVQFLFLSSAQVFSVFLLPVWMVYQSRLHHVCELPMYNFVLSHMGSVARWTLMFYLSRAVLPEVPWAAYLSLSALVLFAFPRPLVFPIRLHLACSRPCHPSLTLCSLPASLSPHPSQPS